MRFPGFEGEWESSKIGEVVDFKITNSFSRENLNYEIGLVKNIHYGDIHTKFQTLFDITKEQVPFVNDNIFIGRISEDNYCKEGDIIFADASENLDDVGKSIEIVKLNNEKLLSGLHTLLARPKDNLFYKGFSGYLFQSNNVRLKIQKEAQGSKVLSISTGRIASIELTFPTLDEQQKISVFLSQIDERILLSSKIIEELKSFKSAVSKKIFSQELRFKDENGDNYPDWEVNTLGDVAERITSKNKLNNKNVLTISAQYGLISQLEFFNKSVSAKDLTGYYLLKENDFAYNKSYSFGYPMGAIKRLKRYSEGVVSTLYICFRFGNKVNLSFMEQYFEIGKQNSEIEKVAQEGARNHGLLNIGINDFFNINLILPCYAEQNKIADFLFGIAEKIDVETSLLQQLKLQKQYFLQQMFI